MTGLVRSGDQMSLPHFREGAFEEIGIGGVFGFAPGDVDEAGFEGVFSGALNLVVNAKASRPWFTGDGHGGGDVGLVVLFFIDRDEFAALAGDAGVECTGEEFNTLGKNFDDGETGMLGGAFHHFDHMFDLSRMTAGDKGRTAVDEFAHRVDGLVDRAGGVGLAFEALGGSGRRLLLGETVDLIVHDDVGQIHILTSDVIKVITTDREAVAITTEDEDFEVGAAEADAGGERHGATVNEVPAVSVDEVRKAGGATDTRHGDDVFVRVIKLFEGAVEGGEDREISTTGTPSGMIGGECFASELGCFRSGRGG